MKTTEDKDPYLSVIIPVHNKQDTLPRLLTALKEQKPQPSNHEIIFIVDACCDRSLQILNLARQEQCFQIVETKPARRGPSHARNLGIETAKGKHCLFIDADILLPTDFLKIVEHYCQEFPNAVYFPPVYGNSGSLSTWPFLVPNHRSIEELNNKELLLWAKAQKSLKDLRLPFVEKSEGWFDCLPAPWVFCWSSVMIVPRQILLRVGGFYTSFREKGSEDLELGYRLHQLRIRFRLMLDTYVFHLPHKRDRDKEERIDRLQERQMLNMYPTREMEALCSFDGSHANAMIQCLEVINSETTNQIKTCWKTSFNVKKLELPDKIPLMIGTPNDWMLSTWKPDYTVNPTTDSSSQNLSLIGLALPFDDKTFTSAILVGLWQILPERLSCRIFQEALRVAERVFLLKNSQIPVESIAWSTDTLAIHDAPYWERTCILRRSFFDFSLTTCGQEGSIELFQIQYYP